MIRAEALHQIEQFGESRDAGAIGAVAGAGFARRSSGGTSLSLFAAAFAKAVREAGLASRISIQSFDWRTLKVVQAEAPEIATVYLSARQKWFDSIDSDGTWTAGIRHAVHGSLPRMVQAAGGKIWSPFFGDVDAATLAEARALGIAVVVWTVNAPADIARMIELGVEGIISDRPDLVRVEMQKRAIALPAPTPVSP
jgi:glycerophosphoryl diester phosphodiesterase